MVVPPRQLTPRRLFETIKRIHEAEKMEDRTPDEQEMDDVILVGSAAHAGQFHPGESDIDLVAVVSGVVPGAVSRSLAPTLMEQHFQTVVRASGLSIQPVEGAVDIAVYHRSRIDSAIKDGAGYSLRNGQVCQFAPE